MDFESLAGIIGKLAIAAPFAAAFAKISPPWPDGLMIAFALAVLQLTIILISFEVLLHQRPSLRLLLVTLCICGAVVVSMVILYTFAFGNRTAWNQVQEKREAIGGASDYLPTVQPVVDALSLDDPESLFQNFHDADAIWTSASIQASRNAVLVISRERRGRMEIDGIFGGRSEAVPFFGDHMQQDRFR